jgi:hypothetical protein
MNVMLRLEAAEYRQESYDKKCCNESFGIHA